MTIEVENANPDSIVGAAVRDAAGSIFVGRYHGEAIDRAHLMRAKPIAGYSAPCWDVPFHVGFVTLDGEFLSRVEAYQHALRIKQIKEDGAFMDQDGIHSNAFKDRTGQYILV